MIKRRERQLSEMVYFKHGYVQDLEDMVEYLKKENQELKEKLKKNVPLGDYGDYVGIEIKEKEVSHEVYNNIN